MIDVTISSQKHTKLIVVGRDPWDNMGDTGQYEGHQQMMAVAANGHNPIKVFVLSKQFVPQRRCAAAGGASFFSSEFLN